MWAVGLIPAVAFWTTLIERGIEPDEFPFSLFALVGVVLLFIREALGISAALQRRIINTFISFIFIFVG